MRKMIVAIFMLCFPLRHVSAQIDSTKFTVVKLRCFERIISVQVPNGVRNVRDNYLEGTVNFLVYKGAAKLTLQCGGMYHVPMLEGDKYMVDSTITKIVKKRLIRPDVRVTLSKSGHIKNSNLVWREDNLGMRNIAYDSIDSSYKSIFDSVIDSLWIKIKN